jgi:cytochrome c biogenesis protein CcmG/thiol:disulfide interchange protein DsbE
MFADKFWLFNRRHAARLAGIVSAMLLSALAAASDLDLNAYRGKVVYIDFWASWCAPCRESFPWLDDLARHYGSKNLVVIGVNVDQDRTRAERFLDQVPAGFPIVYDPHGEIATAFKVTGMPSAVLIDRTGRVRFQHSGFSARKKGEYEDQLQALLDESIRHSAR